MRKRTEWYLVQGYVGNALEQLIVEAYTARQACYRFCREFQLDEAEDVLFLHAVNLHDPDDTFWAEL